MPGERNHLVLNYPHLDERVNQLFEQMSGSRALRESFLRDPAGITWTAVFDGAPGQARTKLSSANRLLYCFLADPGMREWASGRVSTPRSWCESSTICGTSATRSSASGNS